MPETLAGLLYTLGVILILSRFLAGQDLGFVRVPVFSRTGANTAAATGVLLVLLTFLAQKPGVFCAVISCGSGGQGTIRFTPEAKSEFSLPDGEEFSGTMETRVYSQHDYVYLRLNGTRVQLYKLIPKPIGSNNQGCTIELQNYTEIPPTSDVLVNCS